MTSKYSNKTSAAETAIGFDYQFYYCFLLMLGLEPDQTISFEDKDDIAIELNNGKIILIQTKHTLQTDYQKDPINLTERDHDLWKSLSNWAVIIKNGSGTDSGWYLFQLVSNKINRTNPLLQKILKYQQKTIVSKDLKKYINTLLIGTKDTQVIKWMENVLKLKTKERDILFSSLEFTLDQDDLIRKIKEKIRLSIVVRDNHEDVYHSLHSNIRTFFYEKIKGREKIRISFDEYKRLFGSCYFTGANGKLPIRRVAVAIPSEPAKLRFIKMLMDINDLDESKEHEIIEHTTNMLLLLNHLEEWEKNGYIGPSVRQIFDKDSILKWRNIFRESTRSIEKLLKAGREIEEIDAEIIEGALRCLDTIRKEVLTIEDTLLDTALSNGQFYLLSENEQIGWRYDWKS